MEFHLLTIFPDIFNSYLSESLFKRAQEKKMMRIKVHNLRDFASGPHKKVDDRPFGGGPGMVMQVAPIYKAIQRIKKPQKTYKDRIILFSTRGKKLDAAAAKRLARYDRLIFICGRYEGVDERVAGHIADEEISIGDYVLSGGELAAMVTMEAVSRFLPGFLGKYESLEEVKGSYPVYTRPPVFAPTNKKKKGAGGKTKTRSWSVPRVLLSGDHKKIEEWRRAHR